MMSKMDDHPVIDRKSVDQLRKFVRKPRLSMDFVGAAAGIDEHGSPHAPLVGFSDVDRDRSQAAPAKVIDCQVRCYPEDPVSAGPGRVEPIEGTNGATKVSWVRSRASSGFPRNLLMMGRINLS